MNREVVVAKYREDISWTKLLRSKVTVYDKSPEPIDGSITLPNVGREGHTYIFHILDRWDSLAEWTVFLQGWPWAHAKQDRSTITLIDQCRDMFRAINEAFLVFEEPACCFSHGIAASDLAIKAFARKLPPRTKFTPGACFLVHRDRIKAIDEVSWRRALLALSQESDPLAGYGMERLWMWLFTT